MHHFLRAEIDTSLISIIFFEKKFRSYHEMVDCDWKAESDGGKGVIIVREKGMESA